MGQLRHLLLWDGVKEHLWFPPNLKGLGAGLLVGGCLYTYSKVKQGENPREKNLGRIIIGVVIQVVGGSLMLLGFISNS